MIQRTTRSMVLLAAACCLGLGLATSAGAQESAPAAAKALIEAGRQQAKKQHKSVLVMFHSSW